MTVPALLLAGGRGQRLWPLTATTPKCLVPIGDRSLLDHWVAALLTAGVRRAVINTHHLAEKVREKVAQINATTHLQLQESYEPELLGSAGTVSRHGGLANDAEALLIIYADNLSNVALADLLAFHRGHGDDVSVLLFRAPRPEACGIVSLDAASRVLSFEEKPLRPTSDLANAGVYVFSPAAFRRVADLRAFDLASEVLPRLVGQMRGFLHEGYHLDIGTPEALARARADVASSRFSCA